MRVIIHEKQCKTVLRWVCGELDTSEAGTTAGQEKVDHAGEDGVLIGAGGREIFTSKV